MRYIFTFLFLSSLVLAKSYALVLGVGEYKNLDHSKNLRGISKDIKNIKEILNTLGVKDIECLVDERATRARVVNKLQKYIKSRKNIKSNTFILYYTGHGVQIYDRNGDESDGKDEAFALYDVSIKEDRVINGGLLLDDELYYILSKIKSKKILILDKCYSDSSYRSVALSYSKSFGKDYSISNNFLKKIQNRKWAKDLEDIDENTLNNYIILSASKDKEIAEDSPDGGLFTLSLKDAIVYGKANKNREKLTLGELEYFCKNNIFDLASRYRKESKGGIDISGKFSPRFRPNSILNMPLSSIFSSRIRPIKKKREKEKQLLEDTLDNLLSRKLLTLSIDKDKYRDEDMVTFEITSKKSGYLNIFIAYRDSYKLFLKNRKIDKRRLYTFPNDFFKNQYLEAKKSKGKTNIYAILSQKPISIEKFINSQKGDNLKLTNHFRKELTPYKIKVGSKKKKIIEKEANILGLDKVSFDVSH
jgi:hypothetical protein